VAWQYNGDPKLRCAFALTHTSFWWASGNRLVREDANENLALSLQETSDRDTASFDLIVLDPTPVQRLEAKLTKVEFVTSTGDSLAASTLRFSVFRSAG